MKETTINAIKKAFNVTHPDSNIQYLVLDVVNSIELIEEAINTNNTDTLPVLLNVCENHVYNLVSVTIQDWSKENILLELYKNVSGVIRASVLDGNKDAAFKAYHAFNKNTKNLVEKAPEFEDVLNIFSNACVVIINK